MKISHQNASPTPAPTRPTRYTIRLRPTQAVRLERLGRLDKRRFAEVLRSCLDAALDQWEASRMNKAV